MLEHKCFRISGNSTPIYMEGCESRGSVCKPARAGSVIEVARIEGKIFKTMKEAEAHGLELAREWVDARRGVSSTPSRHLYGVRGTRADAGDLEQPLNKGSILPADK
jgi:hypothetical protein